ncbi:MAG: alpha/beta fold hydrolase [Acidobacteriota bacterium]|nr:MAG: alpha/beta fold hydrolase [Acidobacteriota bacterium]
MSIERARFAEVNGIRLSYGVCGTGEPLLLIPGLGADSSSWAVNIAAYSQTFTCIALDNRGSGQSDKPPGPYTTREMAADAAALLQYLGIESAHVAGLSMGGAIAQMLALNSPQTVRSLILSSSWARCDFYTKAVFRNYQRLRLSSSPEDFVRLVQLWIFAPPYFERHPEELRLARKEASYESLPADAFTAQCSASIEHDTLDDLSRIDAPTLITSGDEDIFIRPHFAQELNRRIKNSRWVRFPRCGHGHHLEASDRYNEKTLEFLLEQKDDRS